MNRFHGVCWALAVTLPLVGACGSDEDEQGMDGAGKADQISGRDDPSGLLTNAERRLNKLVTTADVGKTFGRADADARGRVAGAERRQVRQRQRVQ
jgi:hypothetical protein